MFYLNAKHYLLGKPYIVYIPDRAIMCDLLPTVLKFLHAWTQHTAISRVPNPSTVLESEANH